VTRHRIEVKPAARQALLGLPKPTRRRLQHTIDSLAEQPRPEGARELPGTASHTLKLSAGPQEVLYAINADLITILDVAPRTSPWQPTHQGGR
jgi:mRNA-degrading endonuclease RelE of RelBE toxin-antitoxin system